MSGGRIGLVDLIAANNQFHMWGGQVDTNVIALSGHDTLVISGGSILGFVSVDGGNDSFTMTGGSVGGEVRLFSGTDTFAWNGGGTIGGAVLLGDGDDSASLSGLTDAILAITPSLDGGAGTDGIILDGTTASGGGRFVNWEAMGLSNGSAFLLGDTLTLGDAGTLTGALEIGAGSRLVVEGGAGRDRTIRRGSGKRDE